MHVTVCGDVFFTPTAALSFTLYIGTLISDYFEFIRVKSMMAMWFVVAMGKKDSFDMDGILNYFYSYRVVTMN